MTTTMHEPSTAFTGTVAVAKRAFARRDLD